MFIRKKKYNEILERLKDLEVETASIYNLKREVQSLKDQLENEKKNRTMLAHQYYDLQGAIKKLQKGNNESTLNNIPIKVAEPDKPKTNDKSDGKLRTPKDSKPPRGPKRPTRQVNSSNNKPNRNTKRRSEDMSSLSLKKTSSDNGSHSITVDLASSMSTFDW